MNRLELSTKPQKVSNSRLTTWLACKEQYAAKYLHDPRLPETVHKKTTLGSVIHSILECLMDTSSVVEREVYAKYSIENGTLHPTMARLYRMLIRKYGISGDEDIRELGETLLLKTFCHGFCEHKKIIDIERGFEIPVSPNVSITGFIDRVQEIDENTIELEDYKSGRPYSPNDCESSTQPFFYLIAAKTLYPKHKNVIFTFHFLSNKKSYTISPKTQQELKNFKGFIVSQGMAMKVFDASMKKPTRSWICKFCSFKSPQLDYNYSGCSAFYDAEGQSIYGG